MLDETRVIVTNAKWCLFVTKYESQRYLLQSEELMVTHKECFQINKTCTQSPMIRIFFVTILIEKQGLLFSYNRKLSTGMKWGLNENE